MSGKKGMTHPGRAKGILNRTTIEIAEMVCKVCGDPLVGMAKIANGDVVALGYMTEKELKEPPSYDRNGRVIRPSGMERALNYVPPELRARMFNELAQYCYAKRRVMTVENADGSNIGAGSGGVVFYLPANGRDQAPPTIDVRKKT